MGSPSYRLLGWTFLFRDNGAKVFRREKERERERKRWRGEGGDKLVGWMVVVCRRWWWCGESMPLPGQFLSSFLPCPSIYLSTRCMAGLFSHPFLHLTCPPLPPPHPQPSSSYITLHPSNDPSLYHQTKTFKTKTSVLIGAWKCNSLLFKKS